MFIIYTTGHLIFHNVGIFEVAERKYCAHWKEELLPLGILNN